MKTQAEALAWQAATFGPAARNRQERARRMLEEALELAQAEGVTVREVDRLMWRVYARPPGDTAQEIAGLTITLAGLAENAGVQVADAVAAEWDRLAKLTPGYLAAKHAAKVADGVAMP